MSKTTFTEKPDDKQLLISREFDGPLELVWRAWTEPELLDQWFAPKPWKSVTKSADFSEGGSRLYCMEGPNGEQHWGITHFLKIVHHEYYDAEDYFCDAEGTKNEELPGTTWHTVFTETATGTRVDVTTTFESVEALKQLIEMGVQEGTRMAHDNLDELLAAIQN